MKAAGHRPAAELPLLGSNQDSPDPESGVLPVTPRGSAFDCDGAEGDRTPDLCRARTALSQLSYSPVYDGPASLHLPGPGSHSGPDTTNPAVKLSGGADFTPPSIGRWGPKVKR